MILVLLLYVVNMGIAEVTYKRRQHVAAGAVDGVMSAVTRCEDGLVLRLYIFSQPAATVLMGLHGDG